jgi:parallel beta-helix repeat protein
LKKIVYATILALLLAGTSVFAYETYQAKVISASGTTWLVGPVPPFQYTSIQDAVNNASNGDIIEVFNASIPYYENVVVNKSLIIRPFSGNHQSPRVVGGFNVTSPDVEINSLVIRDGNYGILLNSSSNTITGNTIVNDTNGLTVAGSSNTITNNTITNNTYAIYVGGDSNILRTNTMAGNGWNFGMAPTYQDVDTSNTINGKPIYYWVNKTGGSIPTDAGYVCIINSSGVNVSNLVLQNNYEGVLVAYSSQIIIRNCSTVYTSSFGYGIVLVNVSHSNIEDTDLEVGQSDLSIWLVNSDNNNITNNTIATHGSFGAAVWLDGSNNNEIANNVIAGGGVGWGKGVGIAIENSLQNSVVANNISSTWLALAVDYSSGTIFFHNNFLSFGNNFAVITNSSVRSDNGYEGNYYGNFTGEDRNGDGIIDTNHTIYTPFPGGIWIDNCPLLQPWSAQREFNRYEYDSLGNVKTIPDPQDPQHTIELLTNSNSTLASFNYTKFAFTLNATCGYDGFMNLTIPRNWIDGLFDVTIDKVQANADVKQDSTYSYIYFNYTKGSHMIEILGTEAGSIPGDLNGDGKVSLADLVLLAKYYGAKKYP